MPRLAARLSLPTLKLLGPRARFRPTLLTGLRRIRRRRPGTRPRVLAKLLLQPPNPPLQLLTPGAQALHRPRQLEDHLNATLPPRVVDRLGLRAVHTPKIRRADSRSLLWRPTTERLHFLG